MKEAKNRFRIGDIVVIVKYEHGDEVGTITTVKDISANVLMLNTKRKTIFGHFTDTFVAQAKNCRLATKKEIEYFNKQKKVICNIKGIRK